MNLLEVEVAGVEVVDVVVLTMGVAAKEYGQIFLTSMV